MGVIYRYTYILEGEDVRGCLEDEGDGMLKMREMEC